MPAQRKYPVELRERAVKAVLEIREREGKGHGEIVRVAHQLGVHREALRSWLQQAEIDGGTRPGTTTADKQRITEFSTFAVLPCRAWRSVSSRLKGWRRG
jgi:transposase